MFFDALRRRFGSDRGLALWNDLRQANDPTTPVSVDGSFPYDNTLGAGFNNVILDDDSFNESTQGSS
jgi:hypothetical protein